MAESVALSKFACPACGGEATWNPAKQKLVCPFCGTESRGEAGCRRRDRRARSRRRAARHRPPDPRAGRPTSARSSARAATRSRCSIRRARRRTANSAARRSSCPYDEAKPAFRPGERAAVPGERVRGARSHPRVVRPACGSRRRRSSARAHRHGARRLPAVLDVRRASRRRMDRRGGPLLLHDGDLREQADARETRQVQHVRWEPAAGRVSAFLRRRSRLRVGRRPSGAVCAGSSRSRRTSSKPYDAGFVAGWVVERYQIDLAAAAAARARRHGRASCRRSARSRFRATPSAISSSTPTIRARRSSTSSRRCGCCPTRTAPARSSAR